MPLQPQLSFEHFDKWGMEFIGLINPPSNQNEYILACTYYVTKWVEVRPLKNAKQENIASFLYEEIFTRYGVPREIVANQGTQFTYLLIEELMKEYEIRHRNSTPYNP